MRDGWAFTGITLMVTILGSYVIWLWNRWQNHREQQATAEWKQAFEPAQPAHGYTREDVLTTRPLLMTDYRRLDRTHGRDRYGTTQPADTHRTCFADVDTGRT